MKAFFQIAAEFLILAGLGSLVNAQEAGKEPVPAKRKIVAAEEVKKGPEAGKLVILQTGHVMEGDIKRTDTQICIRKDKSELWISCDKALRICADWDDAYTYLQASIDPNDAGGHVRLARWCFANHLHDKAMDQVTQALQIQPTNSEAKLMRGTLERARLERPTAKTVPALSAPPAKAEPAADVGVTYDTLVAFANRVQPILMNTCANCHATGRGGAFQLQRASSLSQKAATERNLARVIGYLDLERPSLSPLLVKAVQIHWKDQPKQPPIKDRSAAAQSMQVWTEQLIARNPHLRDAYAARKSELEPRLSSSTKQTPFASPEESVAHSASRVESRRTTATPANAIAKTNPLPPAQATPLAQAPAVAAVSDEFDPEIFNRLPQTNR